jgi:predicted transcriptional regulator
MEKLLSALELNFLVTKYHEMRDKSGKDVCVFALFYGLCESERLPWGYPKGRRDDRSYFVQRCFNYNGAIQQFLSRNQTIRCHNCGACFGMEKRENLEFYKWRCPECQTGICNVVSLGDDFKNEMDTLKRDTMLPPVELEILESLHEEGSPMKAGEIAALVDTTYQLVGHRTSKLHQMGLVHKTTKDGANRSTITDKARQRYFGMALPSQGVLEND